MKVTPLFKRYLVFHMPVRRKLKGSKLYVGNSHRGSMSRAEEVWIIEKGTQCTYDLDRGDHCWLYDAFELTECEINLWDKLKCQPEFEKLRALSEDLDADVVTKLVFEGSILAVDPEYQIDPVVHDILWQG